MIDTGLQGRVALITGANSPLGIGAAIARAFAREGARVFLAYLRRQGQKNQFPAEEAEETMEPGRSLYAAMGMKSADEVVGSIIQAGGRAAASEADLADPVNVPLLFDKAESEFGHVNVLVNNAAYCPLPDALGDLTA